MGRVGDAISNAPVMSRLLVLLTIEKRVIAAEVVAEHREQTVAASTLEADGANGRALYRAFDDAEDVLDARASLGLLSVVVLLEIGNGLIFLTFLLTRRISPKLRICSRRFAPLYAESAYSSRPSSSPFRNIRSRT